MSRRSTVYEILIASPSDVVAERTILAEVIEDWNSANSRTYGISLQALRWELDSVPATGDRVQAILNRQLVEGADILMGVFWARLGTPTGKAVSGTAEEIEHFRNRQKPVLLYFSEANIPHRHDAEQLRLLNEYRVRLEPDTLLSRFHDGADLRRRAARDLANTINGLEKSSISNPMATAGKNDFARMTMKRRNSLLGANVTTVVGEIQNISHIKRIRQYSYTFTVPKCCLSFNSAGQSSEIACGDAGWRKFRFTEESHGKVEIFPGDSSQIIAIDISVDHLPPDERNRCLSQFIKAEVVVDGETLQMEQSIDDLIISGRKVP
jgi:hypothetical protein